MATMRKTKSMYGETVYVVEDFRPYRVYVRHKGGKHGGYYLSTSLVPSLDTMIDVNGEYWFGSLRELKLALAH